MKKVRSIRPENVTNYILGIFTEIAAITLIMISAFVIMAALLRFIK